MNNMIKYLLIRRPDWGQTARRVAGGVYFAVTAVGDPAGMDRASLQAIGAGVNRCLRC